MRPAHGWLRCILLHLEYTLEWSQHGSSGVYGLQDDAPLRAEASAEGTPPSRILPGAHMGDAVMERDLGV